MPLSINVKGRRPKSEIIVNNFNEIDNTEYNGTKAT